MTHTFVRAIGLAAMFSAVAVSGASALDRRVQVNNLTSYDIVEFYASNTGTTDWEEDILGTGILAAGESVTINIDDGSGYCKFDFLTVFSDGTDLVTSDNNVCELSEFNITE